MHHASLLKKKPTKIRTRVRPTRPRESLFTRPPMGLPVDFYDKDWFNNTLSVTQRDRIADVDNMMFLPEPELSLLGKAHPDERLSDKRFTEKYWSKLAKDYNMDCKIEREDSEDEDSDDDDSSFKGSSVDLSDTDGDEDGEENEENEYEDEEEEEEEFENTKGKGKEKATTLPDQEEDSEEEEFEEPLQGRGSLFVNDEQMYDAEDDARALRWDAWKDA